MEQPLNRRIGDRRSEDHKSRERRLFERRAQAPSIHKLRLPAFAEQRIQFLTRYLFAFLGLAFFNLLEFPAGPRTGLDGINLAFVLYLIFNSVMFYHAWRQPVHPIRYRIAMWTDIFLVGLCIFNDPYAIPPSLVVLIIVVLGNGMRYGMLLFAEALAASFLGALVALSLRHVYTAQATTPGLIFLNLFGGIILFYAYFLMYRIETARNKLEISTRQDELTGLMNRMGLIETAASLFKTIDTYGGMATVLFIDLDKFKSVNDSHGHAMGDTTLRGFADILRDQLRTGDIAARYGGDEFVVLMPETSADEGELSARRIRAAFAAWAAQSGLVCSVSIGIGEAPRDGRSLDEVLKETDAALYYSKTNGLDGVSRADRMPAGYRPNTGQA